jgi:hypothetical protein
VRLADIVGVFIGDAEYPRKFAAERLKTAGAK